MPIIDPQQLSQFANAQADSVRGITRVLNQAFAQSVQSADTNEFIQGIRYTATGICVFFIILNMIHKYNNTQHQDKTDDLAKPYSIRDFIWQFTTLVVVTCFPYLFNLLEQVLLALNNSMQNSNVAMVDTFCYTVKNFIVIAAKDLTATMAKTAAAQTVVGNNTMAIAGTLADAIAPNKYVYTFSAINIVLAFFNYCMGFVLFFERYILVFTLKIIAPIVFALYVSKTKIAREKTEKFFYYMIAIYLVYPIGLLLFRVVDFCFLQISTITNMVSNMTGDSSYLGSTQLADFALQVTNYDTFLFTGLLVICVMIKFTFLNKTMQMLWRILG